MVVATGARVRTHPSVPEALTLRTISDAKALREVLVPGAQLVIIGGGYVGLEVASAAIARGTRPVIVERERNVLVRTASKVLAEFIEDYQRCARPLSSCRSRRYRGATNRRVLRAVRRWYS